MSTGSTRRCLGNWDPSIDLPASLSGLRCDDNFCALHMSLPGTERLQLCLFFDPYRIMNGHVIPIVTSPCSTVLMALELPA
jgi:hypothetical protein